MIDTKVRHALRMSAWITMWLVHAEAAARYPTSSTDCLHHPSDLLR